MARIRNIKPEFFESPDLQDIEMEYPGQYPMFVYAGLWTQCSKNGVFPWQPRILKLHVLPFLTFDMAITMGILESTGYVKKFVHEGKEYGFIPTFQKHQTISGQEKKQNPKYPDYLEPTIYTDRGVTGKCEGSDKEESGQADLGLRTLDLGRRTLDTTKVSKGVFGEFGNVALSESEHQKLVDRYGNETTDAYIAKLSCWKKSKGKATKSDYATILSWAAKDNVKPIPPPPPTCPTCGKMMFDGFCADCFKESRDAAV